LKNRSSNSRYLKEQMNTNSARKIFWLFILLLMLNSTALPSECITEESHANRYFRADLIIFGEVLSCTTSVIRTENTSGDSGVIHRHTTFQTSCFVKVDSMLKGYYSDSIIVVFDENTQDMQTKFEKLDEKGESLFVGEMTVELTDKIYLPSASKWIIFLVDKDGDCYFLWYTEYNKGTLDLYHKFEEKGEDYFIKHSSEFFFQQ
jgi:hypothetical protein